MLIKLGTTNRHVQDMSEEQQVVLTNLNILKTSF